MKKICLCLCIVFFTLLLLGCRPAQPHTQNDTRIDATEHGLSTENDGEDNSKALQALIDRVSVKGGIVYIPAGEYQFAENGRQAIGSHCIKMRSGVSIVGDGEKTVLLPVGHSQFGLDMFYFNDYLDTGKPTYLENCRFEDFVIDAAGTSCEVYTSAGKGFMFNLFKNCHWKGVTVANTDATGFGVDCPIDSTITDCRAIGCGKAATEDSSGASGFGIGYGFCENESMAISNCTAIGNKKFGFFFEHQGRFDGDRYGASSGNDFKVTDCIARENTYGFGGIWASGMLYERCTSEYSARYGFYFEDSSNAQVVQCHSAHEGNACFAARQTKRATYASDNISFLQSTGERSPIALYVEGTAQDKPMQDIRMQQCELSYVERAVQTQGCIASLTLTDNNASVSCGNVFADADALIDEDNSWN